MRFGKVVEGLGLALLYAFIAVVIVGFVVFLMTGEAHG